MLLEVATRLHWRGRSAAYYVRIAQACEFEPDIPAEVNFLEEDEIALPNTEVSCLLDAAFEVKLRAYLTVRKSGGRNSASARLALADLQALARRISAWYPSRGCGRELQPLPLAVVSGKKGLGWVWVERGLLWVSHDIWGLAAQIGWRSIIGGWNMTRIQDLDHVNHTAGRFSDEEDW